MEVKPGYKHTETGVIPKDWEVESFGKLFVFSNGVNTDKGSYGTGFRFVNVLEPITHSHLYGPEISGRVRLPEQVANAYTVRAGDVLFNRTSETDNEIGLAATYLGTEHVVFGGFVIRGRPLDARLDYTYSGYALRAPAIRTQIIPMGQGAIRANIGQKNLKQVITPIPPKAEQSAIAAALSDVDALLGGLDRLIAKKRDLKQSVMQQLFTGETRLPGFKEEREIRRLGDVIEKLIGGGTPSRSNPAYWGDEIPWVTVKDFATFNPRQTQESITKVGLNNSASHLIPAGTLITSTRMALGKAVVYEVDVAINQDLKALFLIPNTYVRFIYYWFQYNAQLIDALGSGSTVKGISISELKGVPFPHLSLSEQTAIAAVLSDMDAEIAALENRLDKTRNLKTAMMQELLTGRTRLVPTGAVHA